MIKTDDTTEFTLDPEEVKHAVRRHLQIRKDTEVEFLLDIEDAPLNSSTQSIPVFKGCKLFVRWPDPQKKFMNASSPVSNPREFRQTPQENSGKLGT